MAWAQGVLLAVTGVPKEQRGAVEELLQRAGGRYSSNLSRRCTHLAVPSSSHGAAAATSEKLRSAAHNQHKWGLHIVDLRWLLESAAAGRRLDEALFPVQLPAFAAAGGKEQAAPGASAGQPAASKGSLLAADTYQPQGPAAGQAARPPPDPLRASVNSRPLSSFSGAAPSLQTQGPSVQRSVRWQGSKGSWAQQGPSGAAAAAAPHAPVLPAELERRRQAQQDGAEGEAAADWSRLPMTQAGFLPAADLLEQLRASTAGLPPAGGLQQQQPWEAASPSPERSAGQQQQPGRQADASMHSPLQALHHRYAVQQGGAMPAPMDASPGAPAPAVSPPVQQKGAASTADLLHQLRLSMAGLPAVQQRTPEQQRQRSLSTAELLEQLRGAVGPAAVPPPAARQPLAQPAPPAAEWLEQAQPGESARHAALSPQQAEQRRAGLSTEELLQQLRQGPAAQPQHQPALWPAEAEAHAGSGAGAAAQEAAQQQLSGLAEAPHQPADGSAAAPRSRDLGSLLQQLQQLAPVADGGTHAAADVPQQQQAQQPAVAAASRDSPAVPGSAVAAVPHMPPQAATAAASQLAAQMRSLLGQGQLSPEPATAAAGNGRSTEELAALLRQRPAAADVAAGSPALGAAPLGGTDGLLAKLRQLGPQQSFTPLRQQGASDEQELPPAKYPRQQQAEAPAAEAAALPTPAADAAAAGSGGASLPSTAVVSGGTPASSAGSPQPPADRLAAQAAAAAAVPAASPAVSGSDPPAVASQVAESGGRVFSGIVALLDPNLLREEQQRVRDALEKGGGRCAEGGSLGSGVTHVVCQPEAALQWLSMGVAVVSPQWVLQSLRAGKQQRCLAVSADASRHLPAASVASSGEGAEAGAAAGSGSIPPRRPTQEQQPQLSSELLQSKEARQRVLSQLAGSGGGEAAAADAAAGAHQQAATPAELLAGVVWSVLEPPAAATMEGQRAPPQPEEGGDVVVIPDSEDEEEGASWHCITASQAVVDGVLQEAGAAPSPRGGGAAQPALAAVDASWRDAVVLRGPAELTLLLPRDGRGELGLDTRCIPLGGPGQPRALTAAGALAAVHSFYAEALQPEEQLQLLQAFPGAEGAGAALRGAFLELAPLPRGALLGPRCRFEGLRKATRDPAGAVYELQLGW